MKLHIPDNIANILPYPPGKTQGELEREYGVSGSIKLAPNENAWGPSPRVIRALCTTLADIHRYPDSTSHALVQGLAAHFGVDAEEVVLGNGSNEVFDFLVKAFVSPGDQVITSHPSFLMYQKFVQIHGGENFIVQLKDMRHDLVGIGAMISEKTRLIFLDNPNNPTGSALSLQDLHAFFSQVPESVIVVLDKAYVDFMDKDLQVDIVSLIRNTRGLLLFEVPGDAHALYDALLHRGVIVRPMQAYCFPDCLRITVGTEAENERFLTELDSCLRELGYV